MVLAVFGHIHLRSSLPVAEIADSSPPSGCLRRRRSLAQRAWLSRTLMRCLGLKIGAASNSSQKRGMLWRIHKGRALARSCD
jgi:hypothetical protein